MLAAGAQQCPICTLSGYQCDHELVCWSDGTPVEGRMAGRIAALACIAEQVMARALSLRVSPTPPELKALYAAWSGLKLEHEVGPDCFLWAMKVAESWSGVDKTDDGYFRILWAGDADAVRKRLDDLQRALEIEMCRHPGDLRLIPSNA
jgi:hypothetical protein